VVANLVIFAAITALIYLLFRRAWGVLAAFVATALLIAVFGFSQFGAIGNYNFATPYAHEATHGLLVCLALAAILPGWVERASPARSLVAGGLFGLSAVLKPEIMLAAGAVSGVAVALRFAAQQRIPARAAVGWMAGALAPTLFFTASFARHVPWTEAMANASRAWLSVIGTQRFVSDPVQLQFLGFDHPMANATASLVAAAIAATCLGVVVTAGWMAERSSMVWSRWAVTLVAVGGLAAVAILEVDWLEAGRALTGLALAYFVWAAITARRERGTAAANSPTVARLLVGTLALALLARMLVHSRLQQFGFYQAALAGVLVPTVVCFEFPRRLQFGRRGRLTVALALIALLAPGIVHLIARSQRTLAVKTHPVGSGRDLFYAIAPEHEPTGDIVAQTVTWLKANASPGQTLLVLPEGEMVNYLARMPDTVAPFFFFSAATAGDREGMLVSALEKQPPDWVVIISRDLREYGIQRYGERRDQGGQILAWVGRNYEDAAALGGDPLDFRDRGGQILKRKATP
jgi:hypothetical protein